MNKTLSTRKIFSLGTIALATSLLVSLLVPTAQANTFSLPNAPQSVTLLLLRPRNASLPLYDKS